MMSLQQQYIHPPKNIGDKHKPDKKCIPIKLESFCTQKR